ncbi:MAG: metal-dependent hydrolase [Candidatus Bathyarchaeota archaeon]|nr:metal-dependent hydrolase [Candidatus Bathyarchaeum tardum]
MKILLLYCFWELKFQTDWCFIASLGLVISVLVGILSHVLLDFTNHSYNPLFWPFSSPTFTESPIYFALGNPLGSLHIHIIMGVLLVGLIFVNRKNLFEKLLVG